MDISRNPYSVAGVKTGLVHFLLGRGAAAVFGFTAAILFVRYMPIAEYAVFATLAGFQIVSVALASIGLDQLITRYIPEARLKVSSKDLAKLVWALFTCRLAALALLMSIQIIAAAWLTDLLNISDHKSAFWAALSYTALFGLSQHVMRTLQALMSQRVVKWAQLLEFLPRLLVVIAWAGTQGYALTACDSFIILSLCALPSLLVMLFALARVTTRATGASSTYSISSSEVLLTARANYLQALLLLPTEMPSMRLVAAHFLSAPSMAAYGFFLTLVSTVRRYLPAPLLHDMAEPVMQARYAESKDFDQLVAATNTMLKATVYILAPIVAAVLLSGDLIIGLLTAGKFSQDAWLLALLLIGLLLDSQWLMLRTICNAVRKPEALVIGAGAALAGMAPLIGLLSVVPTSEILIGGTISFVILQNAVVALLLRKSGYQYQIASAGLYRIALAAMVAFTLGWLLRTNSSGLGLLGELISLSVLVFSYLALARTFGAFSATERELLNRINRRLAWLL